LVSLKRKTFIIMVESELNDSKTFEEFKLKLQELKLVFTCVDSVEPVPTQIKVDQQLSPSLTT
jgi:hypothetical protein